MEITADMRIINKRELFAVGTVTIDCIFRIPGVKVLILHDRDGKPQNIVSLPRKKMQDGSWKEVIKIKDPDVWETIKTEVLRSVHESLKKWAELNDIGVSVNMCSPGGRVNAYAEVTYQSVTVTGIQVMENKDRLKVVYPYNIENGAIKSLVELFSADVREQFTNAILKEYEKMKEKAKNMTPERRKY